MDSFSADERQVIHHACAATWCDFTSRDGPKPAVPASLLRKLLLGVTLPCDDGRHRACAAAGLRIRGARITGPLDLSDCSLGGNPLPSLQLIDCEIEGDISLSGARIGFLSIENSAFVHLRLCGTELRSALDFRSARPLAPGQPAWIDARAARIHGQVLGSSAIVAAPPRRDRLADIPFGGRQAALLFRDADIHGTVILQGLHATGGVSFDTAHVRGDIWAHDATFIAGEIDAFRAQTATIEGSLMLYRQAAPPGAKRGPHVEGMIWLYAARLRGSLVLTGARIYGTQDDGRRHPCEDRCCLELSHAAIGADLRLSRLTARGHVKLNNATIGGSVFCDGMRLANRITGAACVAFGAYNARIGRDLLFGPEVAQSGPVRTLVAGQISLEDAEVGGRLCFDHAVLRAARRPAPAPDGAAQGESCALLATGLRVARELMIRRDVHARGGFDLTGAVIVGNAVFSQARFERSAARGRGAALDLQRASVQGNLRFEGGLRISGELNLLGAQVGRDLLLGACEILNAGGSAVFAKDVTVGGDLRLQSLRARGNLRFERAQVTGVLRWEDLAIDCDRRDPASRIGNETAPLDFNHARIGTAIRARSLAPSGRSRINLSGARTGTLEWWWPEGWGGTEPAQAAPPAPILDLDGLTYDRLVYHAPGLQRRSGPLRRALRFMFSSDWGKPQQARDDEWRDMFRQWLGRQDAPPGSGSDFFPQPYRQAARVLRAQGEDTLARLIACEEQRKAPWTDLWEYAWRRVFGLFGYGLRPRFALWVVIVYLALGTAGVFVAKRDGKLVEVVQMATSYTAPIPGLDTPDAMPAPRTLAFMRAERPDTMDYGEIACNDAANSWFDDMVYALDMIMPFISLHQESRCDIRADGGWTNQAFRAARAAYTFFGWIVTSLALLTFSGFLRRFDRDPD